jgi:glycopeptide antibiotics resistance protein
MFGFGRAQQAEYMYNLKPFSTISHFIQFDNFNTKTSIINLFWNIGVFIPFGILMPMILKLRLYKLFVVFLCILFVLELIQLISRRGSLDIDDFILNSIGFFIGYGIYRTIALRVNSSRGGIA